MKKFQTCVVILILTCFLTACSKQTVTETTCTASEIAKNIMDGQTALPVLHTITPEDDYFTAYLTNYYLLDRATVADGVICYPDGVEAAEIAVLTFESSADAQNAEAALLNYLDARAGSFEGYAPQQAALVKDGTVVVRGNCTALLICPDTARAEAAFLSCFGENIDIATSADLVSTPVSTSAETPSSALVIESMQPSDKPLLPTENQNVPIETESASITEGNNSLGPAISTPEPTAAPVLPTPSETPTTVVDESYNADAVLLAWQTGNDSLLSDTNQSILDAAKAVIIREIRDDMTEYEKELAIHDYITSWSSFSMSAFSHAPGSGGETETDTPYGVLINRSGNCWGYSSTFQLFMKMLGIPCITVRGTPNSGGVEHAWNMVQLDGEWYCVDSAWDDPIGGRPGHSYFNVTSERLRSSGIHHWDETNVPEATGTRYSYGAG